MHGNMVVMLFHWHLNGVGGVAIDVVPRHDSRDRSSGVLRDGAASVNGSRLHGEQGCA